ncbi:hypothetical protein QWZ16_20865 [Vibrio ostreicida]|uniref:DUF3265 domain-containing protein n=1 Tax=Vibrio ostreicida TaxID=526588 RepID=A0ABT8BYE2_9VIBR|nr:hypothetical protein [Vibrio ostreicida]MDN3612048.1 hypothetical protein [Vibrio ostreicida]
MASAQVRTGHHCSRLVYTAIGRAVASLKKASVLTLAPWVTCWLFVVGGLRCDDTEPHIELIKYCH